MGRDKTSYACIRNRAENSHLHSELQRIEREKQDEMRILNTERRRFRTKYSRLSAWSFARPLQSLEGPIYETHEPGSRHRRKVEQQRVGEQDTSTDFDRIRQMVFTDGAVDVEKIACLHLLSAFRSETLSPPKRKALACKEHSPTERLIERSKKGYLNNEKLSRILPLYTVESIEGGKMGENGTVIRDGRLAARLLINKLIRDLLGRVLKALEISNHEKLARLAGLASSPDSLKGIFEKKHIQDFLTFLSDLPLINHCDFFVLTPPFKVKSRDLNVKTSTGALEALVRNIRQNVLQLPTRKLIMTAVEKEDSVGTTPEVKRDPPQKSARILKKENPTKHSEDIVDGNDSNRVASTETSRRYGCHATIDFISKNIVEAAKVRKIEYDTDETGEVFTPRKPNRSSVFKLNMRKTGSPLCSISEGNSENDNATGAETLLGVTSPKSGSTECATGRVPKTITSKPTQPKYHIKQTTCPACMEKWRTPLPSPKTPRLKKSSVFPPADNQLLKTDSIHRIDMLINREMYALESYDRRYSSMGGCFRRNVDAEKKATTIANFFRRYVDLSSIDLARIEQEIKEKETQRKLEMFLGEHVDSNQNITNPH